MNSIIVPKTQEVAPQNGPDSHPAHPPTQPIGATQPVGARPSPAVNKRRVSLGRDTSGIALFMVLAAVSVLAVLVTEFTYIAQVGQMIAYGGLDQIKAHYIAKGAFKLSLLRLKAFQQAKTLTSKMGAGGAVPKSLLDKIWSFPITYPLPTNIPGLTTLEKDMINKFQNESNLEGSFTSIIESESSKFNLNLLIPGFAPSPLPEGSAVPPSSTSQPQTPTSGSPAPVPNPMASFSPEAARDSLKSFLGNIIQQKTEKDTDFASSYRDFRLDDLLDEITNWADRNYERRTSPNLDKLYAKRAPFYSLSELHSIPSIDDEIYSLITPSLTVSSTGGININTMQEGTLRALIPEMTPEETKEFFKFRDSTEADNAFNSAADFYKYLKNSVAAFRSPDRIAALQKDLTDRGINLITDETQFKITVQATAGTSTRTIEAWVVLGDATPNPNSPNSSGNPSGTAGSSSQPAPNPAAGAPLTPSSGTAPASDSGIKITFMRIL